MKKNFFLTLMLLLLALFNVQQAAAQAPVATPAQAITALLNRIGGDGAADKFEIVIDASLAEDGKDVFIITSQNGKPCIKGNTQLSVATGINWYLNHHAHINLTWNNLTTDLSGVTLPVPSADDKHVCNTTYRYDFNTCTFSYSMAFWTWDRWQKEIDWMALHGINAPLNLVGLDVVTRNFLKELGVSDSDINAYIAGPGFIAWFAMNNLEGWGGTINSSSTGVDMSGNPDWWYTRQEQLCKDMLQRMRELGMQPVIPGFSGQVPNCIVNYASKINTNVGTFSSSDVIDNGGWAGGYTRPDILAPSSSSYATLAPIYYKHLEAIMGVSEFYSMDPFHEGSLPSGVTNANCYPNIMAKLDTYHDAVDEDTKTKYNVGTGTGLAKWIIQYWQGVPQSGAFSAMSSYGDRFIGLDLFADNIYADNAAKWRGAGDDCYYQGRPYIYCMLHNFGGRSGLHGRLETTMNGYFEALAKNNNCQGIGATPEGTETNPILYDMLFELPWMDVNSRPTVDEWLEDYAHARYSIENETALAALQNLKKSVWDCKVNQQGTSEAVILARPAWTVGSVSSWSTSAIYWDTQDVRLAADQLISIADLIKEEASADGVANYNYDAIDVVRQAMVDFAAELLPLINAARNNNEEYTRLYNLYLDLMLDLDAMLSYDENFKLERWTSLARNIADEVDGTTDNDRNWLEWNARTQVTVWSKGNTDLHDYSNRCWAGLIKDFHYWRWKYFFENNGGAPSSGWFSGFEYPWTVDFNDVYSYAGDYSEVVIPTDMTATEKAVETFGKYFGRVKGATKNYPFPMGVTTNATKSDVIPEVYRDKTMTLPLVIGKDVTVVSVQIDLNGDGAMGDGETLEVANDMDVAIPADATIGKTKATVTFSDSTVITFNLAIIEDITENRTVTAATADTNMGTVAIEGDDDSDGSITNMDAVKITATANTGYNFKNWTDGEGNVVSNDNPYIYYGKDAASFTANFVEDLWGVVACDGTLSGDIATHAQFIHNLTFAYYNREAETILETTTAPTQIFNTIPQIINVPRGASFDVYYDDGDGSGLQYCYFRAYIDLNADGDFDDEGELLKEVGTNGATNTAVCSNTINVLLPYDAPLGITHMRLRFDGAWDNSNNPSGRGAKDASIRPVYEIILNITEGSNKAAHVTVKSNNNEWGTAEVWTDETPDGSTGTEWDVSSNIPMYLRATPASADVDFLGWYDQYGRLLTTEREYSMLAKEDATYTARFRKLLDIDGWQIEYRTQPGSVAKTNKLANGVKPEDGKTYYIYAYPQQGSGTGTYVARYLYDNSGTLATTEEVGATGYLWTCIVNDDDTYSFQNATGNYLANSNSTNCYLSVGATAATYTFEDPSYEGLTIYNPSSPGGKYMVTNAAGSSFNRYSAKANDGNWSSDYVFVEVSYPDEIILTEVRATGNNDLVIPETVEILGHQCSIVGFDNGLFNNNTELWSITLPSTMEFLSTNELINSTMTGTVASGTGTQDSQYYTIYNLEETLSASDGFVVTVKGTSDGSTFNQWGSGLFASGTDPLATGYSGGFQFYLGSAGNFVLKVAGSAEEALDNSNCKVIAGTPFTATIRYENGTITITVDNGAGQTGTYTKTCTINDISAFSAAIPAGITLDVTVTPLNVAEANPFEGCTNLDAIAIDGTCANYYVDGEGDLYNTAGQLVCSPAGKEKGEKRRALATIIEEFSALIEQVATVDPVGTSSKITLQTEDANTAGYIWTNAEDPEEGSLDYLVDGIKGDNNNFFHSNWHTVSTTEGYHYIEVDLGENNDVTNFKFSYRTRSNDEGLANFPTSITVMGSNNKTDYTDNIFSVTSGLPESNNTDYTSEIFSTQKVYRYLRFKVGAPKVFWHMGEFELYNVTSSADVYGLYETMGITDALVAGDYDALATAIYVFENGTTADEMTAQIEIIEPLYEALKAMVKDPLNGVYQINYNSKPIYVGYRTATSTSRDADGYHLIDPNGDDNATGADALFTIVANEEMTGYTLSAQNLYLKTTDGNWTPQFFSADKANAGIFLFEETETDIFKLKSSESSKEYINDYGTFFGNDESTKENLSTFTLTQVSNYTVTVPATGVTTLCLPFNVVVPAGVEVYDITASDITTVNGNKAYSLNSVAVEGETLAKGTPVIVKAAAGNVTFTITMDSEGAKSATEGSVLRSGLVKTTIGTAEVNYTFSDGVFNKVTADTEVAANQCWMVLDEDAGDMIVDEEVAQGMFMYTTDEENPILYRIQVNRTFNDPMATVLQYNEKEGYVNIAPEAANASYQAWYFMKSANGFVIKPYNAMGKVLGADDNNNGGTKVWAVEIDAKNIDEWTLEKNGNWYNILGNGHCFSNHGGNSSGTMGFYNDKDDGGSQFKFIPMTFDNDNARYYQLKDYTATIDADVALSLANGDPGSFVNGQDYIDAFNAANTLAAGDNTAAAADCYTAYTVLRTAGDNLATGGYVGFTDGAVYRIKNYVKNATDNKYHYLKNNSAAVGFATSVADDDRSAMWVCNVDGDNVSFVSALGTLSLGWKVGANEAAVLTPEKSSTWMAFGVKNDQDKFLVLNNGNTFAEADAMSVAATNSSTDWCFETVGDETLAKYSLKMKKSYEWSTLYLPFAVKVPAGVKAYIAESEPVADGTEKVINLTEVVNVVPERTAVVLKRESAVVAETFNFIYTKENAETDVTGNKFEGRVTEGYIGGDDMSSKNFYILFRGDDGERLYWIYKEYDAAGNNVAAADNGYIKCAANKAYLALDAVANNASSYSFRFGEDSTGVEEITDDRLQSTDVYDLQGRKLTEIAEPGIYIVNGKKVHVK